MIKVPAHLVPYVSDEVFSPGEALRDRMAEIGMTQAGLAARSGLSTKHVNQMVQGAAPITHDTALILERVTGTPARIWNALEASYRESLARLESQSLTPEDLEWLRTLPITDLKKRGAISGSNQGELLQSVLSFFGVADRAAWDRIWLQPAASFRRSQVFKRSPGATAAWLRLGELAGREVACEPFEPRAFRLALHQARELSREKDFSAKLVQLCANAGVALVFIPELPGCRANGAARWLGPSKALIQLSDRHKREDSFWFSFFHEGGHLLRHPKREVFVDAEKRDDDVYESEANEFAAETLIPESFVGQLDTLKSSNDVARFARDIGLAEGIVVGRLHKDGLWLWSRGNNLIRRVEIVDT